jgi:hypothetical protein
VTHAIVSEAFADRIREKLFKNAVFSLAPSLIRH